MMHKIMKNQSNNCKKMCTNEALKRCVANAIQKERKRVHDERKSHPTKKHDIHDYASIVVACGYSRSGKTFSGASASPLYHKYAEEIRRRLEKLGKIGAKRPGCENVIGACAEPHAADMVVKNFPGCKMNELQFSAAYRPRTGQRKKYCINCKDTFQEVL